MTPESQPPRFIVFFDSECSLCQRAVRWILKRDRDRKFYFASLDSDTARSRLPAKFLEKKRDYTWESMVVLCPQDTYRYSTAAFLILSEIRTFWSFLCVFSLLPTSWTDAFYRFVAKRRKKWFGRCDSCTISQDGNFKDRFLD